MSPQTTALLARQLVKRDACAGTVVTGAYDLPLHVGALFIIFGVSGMACAIPLIVTRFPIPKFFFTVRHFGTGVLLATAFVHLLPTAFISLGNPCLPKFWTQDYNSMPGAIALAGVLVVTVIEMILSPARQFIPKPQRRRLASTAGAGREAGDDDEENENALSLVNMSSRAPSPETPSSAVEKLPLDIEPLTPEQQRKKSMLQCVMLEIGILFHSIFIGMALSVSTGGDFVVLLIAISFHREYHTRIQWLIVRNVRRTRARVTYRLDRVARQISPAMVHGPRVRVHVSQPIARATATNGTAHQ